MLYNYSNECEWYLHQPLFAPPQNTFLVVSNIQTQISRAYIDRAAIASIPPSIAINYLAVVRVAVASNETERLGIPENRAIRNRQLWVGKIETLCRGQGELETKWKQDTY